MVCNDYGLKDRSCDLLFGELKLNYIEKAITILNSRNKALPPSFFTLIMSAKVGTRVMVWQKVETLCYITVTLKCNNLFIFTCISYHRLDRTSTLTICWKLYPEIPGCLIIQKKYVWQAVDIDFTINCQMILWGSIWEFSNNNELKINLWVPNTKASQTNYVLWNT